MTIAESLRRRIALPQHLRGRQVGDFAESANGLVGECLREGGSEAPKFPNWVEARIRECLPRVFGILLRHPR